MIIGEVAFEDAREVCFVENDHVIQAFSPDRADQPFNIRRLPSPNEIFRRLIPRERFDQLLRRPYSCRVLGDVEMNDDGHGVAPGSSTALETSRSAR